jgi:hypothetical protein
MNRRKRATPDPPRSASGTAMGRVYRTQLPGHDISMNTPPPALPSVKQKNRNKHPGCAMLGHPAAVTTHWGQLLHNRYPGREMLGHPARARDVHT